MATAICLKCGQRVALHKRDGTLHDHFANVRRVAQSPVMKLCDGKPRLHPLRIVRDDD